MISEITVEIPDIHCKHCAERIALTLKYLAGVETSNVNFSSKNAIIKHDPRIITRQKIVLSLQHLGFQAFLASVS